MARKGFLLSGALLLAAAAAIMFSHEASAGGRTYNFLDNTCYPRQDGSCMRRGIQLGDVYDQQWGGGGYGYNDYSYQPRRKFRQRRHQRRKMWMGERRRHRRGEYRIQRHYEPPRLLGHWVCNSDTGCQFVPVLRRDYFGY